MQLTVVCREGGKKVSLSNYNRLIRSNFVQFFQCLSLVKKRVLQEYSLFSLNISYIIIYFNVKFVVSLNLNVTNNFKRTSKEPQAVNLQFCVIFMVTPEGGSTTFRRDDNSAQ